MSLSKLLREFTDAEKKKIESIGTFLSRKGFKANREWKNHPLYKDSGAFGIIYESPKYPKYVVKVSDFSIGDYGSRKIVGKDIENVVKIFFHKDFSDNGIDHIYVTVMEKLEPLDSEFIKEMEELLDIFNEHHGKHYMMRSAFNKFFDEDEDIFTIALELSDPSDGITMRQDDLKRFLDDIKKGFENLVRHGVRHVDMHMGNILWDPKKRQYKIIDITS